MSKAQDHANERAATRRMTDDEIRARTEEILANAQRISAELTLQTERLAFAIDAFDRTVIAPMREVITDD